MVKFTRRQRPQVWKGLVAGMAGGLVGTIVMTQFQNGWQKASEALQREQSGGSGNGKSRGKSEQEGEDATMKTAGKLAEISGHRLTRQERKKASSFVHYGFGTVMGALYGAMREIAPKSVRRAHPVLAGLGYGTALFVGADEAALPALGLSAGPAETPISEHIYGFAAHAVYGVTGELVLRAVREQL